MGSGFIGVFSKMILTHRKKYEDTLQKTQSILFI